MSRRIYATHRITTVPLDGWDLEHARFLALRKANREASPTPARTRLSLRALLGSE